MGKFWEIGKIASEKAEFPMNFFPKLPKSSQFLTSKLLIFYISFKPVGLLGRFPVDWYPLNDE